MFDQYPEMREATRIASDASTVAGLLAVLYGDPLDPLFVNVPVIPSTMGLEAGLQAALDSGELDAACAIATELVRIEGDEPDASAGLLFGSRAGLWRLH